MTRMALAVSAALTLLFSVPGAVRATGGSGSTPQTAEYHDNPCCRRV